MPEVLSRGQLFQPELVSDLISKVKGKSSLAILSNQEPIPFNGIKEFTFTLDSEIDIVAENGKKTHGGMTVEPVIIQPIKVEYGARVSDEFIFASDEYKINVLKSFNDGFAKKVAKGFDIMAMHGINPRTGIASEIIGQNHFDAKVTQTVDYDGADPDSNMEAAVGMIKGADCDISGAALSPIFATALSKMKVNGVKQFPELSWGANPGIIKGLKTDINKTVEAGTAKDRALVGDFAEMLKWGYAKDIMLDIIEYGDPDGSGKDLKAYNQVYIRAEAYIGWGILDAASFVRIKEA